MKRGRESGDTEAMAMANCLMLLSKVGQIDALKHNSSNRVFACKTCDKTFPSFQALGGHRASHKKPRLPEDMPKKPKTHECSICGVEFPIGQALGGHMRRHRAALNEGLLNPQDLFSEMNKPNRGLCLDLKLAPCGTDLDLEPVVHLFI
ncbi:RESPONSIVE TO HIGH LIGHT 41 [Hibiscus trionum]|uniref:RESPONSIVE TO HIGH LIGHT 41 n=1 Tax=Hibiscus trionum TaxID=183268 RepID=A0A9W7HWN7_HIBTR|nr:RESPONSIVE TO HIGH LIGHT 41 [Hibiscus trionum]